ncbi:ATP-binding protein [Piscinibacter sp.]|uniref:hybrid sensor histidine kinase/response regulator n=1 Tax=Piscinibacter sp. TaxID=1903157 RepID=UPI002BC9143B|nr:ATP-binding protein [Albitalea sp.]HUG21533.1 ATP-binding protein [Albitalea sp.]
MSSGNPDEHEFAQAAGEVEPTPLNADLALRGLRHHALFMLDPSGRIASWNEGVRAVFGRDEVDWIGQPFAVILPPERRATAQSLLKQAYRDGILDDEGALARADGDTFSAAMVLTRVSNDSEHFVGFQVIASDRSELERSEAECRRLLESERAARELAERRAAELDAALESIPDAMYLGDAQGITRCNARGLAMLGVSSIDELRRPIGELGRKFQVRQGKSGDQVAPEELPFNRALNGESSVLETWATHAGTGEDVYLRGTAAPVMIEGRIIGAVAIESDLTPAKRIETDLSERDQQFKALVNGVRDYAIFAIGADGRIASWHAGAMLIKGYTAEEAIGMPFANLFIPEDQVAGRAEMEMRVAAEFGEYKGEGQRLRKDGSRFDAFVVLTATRGPDGELLGYLKLTHDITERKRREAEREALLQTAHAAREEAERANRMKNDFLATISHELRTPLGAILGWSRLLERGLHDAQGIQHGLAAISRNATIQSQLIDDLLDMARIESGTLRLDLAPVEVAIVVAEGVEATAPAAQAKGIVVHTEIDPHTPPVLADAQRLQQVIWNLLSNAVKFTPEGGHVTVSTQPTDFGVEISVSDSGQGIAPSFLPHVFDRFRQHDSSITRRQGGLGLGLAIVKQLVERHGGRVRAESEGENQGSCFFVELPTAAEVRGWRRRGRESRGQPGAPASERLRGVTVLLVDDEPDAREVARAVLERAGASVIEARSAAEGLDALKRHRPDVLLSDVGMPVHDGFEFISWVRRLAADEGGAIPAAAVTAYASSEDRERALRSGFQVHLSKPVDIDAWIGTVERLMEQATTGSAPRPGPG